jgi:hypothetical protein
MMSIGVKLRREVYSYIPDYSYVREHFKNSQQIDYAMDHGNSYANIERNSPSVFTEKHAHIFALICR